MTDDLAISVLFRRIEINSVSVNDTEANYIYDDPLIPVVPPSSRKTANYYPEYRQQYTHALQEADKGELVIDIPSSVVVSQVTHMCVAICAFIGIGHSFCGSCHCFIGC